AQVGSARRSGRRGRRFKSCYPDQNFSFISEHSRRLMKIPVLGQRSSLPTCHGQGVLFDPLKFAYQLCIKTCDKRCNDCWSLLPFNLNCSVRNQVQSVSLDLSYFLNHSIHTNTRADLYG